MSLAAEISRMKSNRSCPKYPAEQKRSAVMPLLYLAQREEGYITKAAMQDIARSLEITRDRSGLAGRVLHPVS